MITAPEDFLSHSVVRLAELESPVWHLFPRSVVLLSSEQIPHSPPGTQTNGPWSYCGSLRVPSRASLEQKQNNNNKRRSCLSWLYLKGSKYLTTWQNSAMAK